MTAKPQGLQERIDLDDVIEPDDLERIVKSLATCSGLAAGIVRMPEDGQAIPSDPAQFCLWRLTEVEPKGPPSTFCEIVREVKGLDCLCMWSDLDHAREAKAQGEPLVYQCMPSGLVDVVAPVEVAGRHVANIYIGRARPPESTFEDHYKRIVANLKERNAEIPDNLREKLRPAFDRLPLYDVRSMGRLKPLLAAFAELLSERANRRVTSRAIEEVSSGSASLRDEKLCSKRFYEQCKRILDFDTGSVFLLRGGGRNAFLEQAILDWGGGQPQSLRFDLADANGLVLLIARQAIRAQPGAKGEAAVLCRSRAEMDTRASPGFADSRAIRRIESFLGVPVLCEEQVLGVLEIGAKRPNAFKQDDQYLLQALAGNLGLSLRACRDRSYMTTIPAQADLKDLSAALVRYLPELTGGTGCSIFMRLGSDPNSEAVLFASTELPNLVGAISYKPGDGLTGWVLKTGRALDIPAGKGARSPEKLRAIDPELAWLGKHKEQDESRIDFMNTAFLAHPVLKPSGNVVGVVRIGSRWTGDFSSEDKEIVRHYANVLGSMVSKTRMDDTLCEIKQELQSLRSEIMTGRRQILKAIRRSPHAFVTLLSEVGFVICSMSIALLVFLKITFIDFRVSVFGCIAFTSYWLMSKASEAAHRLNSETGHRVVPRKS